jgi:preprotein translocase subunit SecE
MLTGPVVIGITHDSWAILIVVILFALFCYYGDYHRED